MWRGCRTGDHRRRSCCQACTKAHQQVRAGLANLSALARPQGRRADAGPGKPRVELARRSRLAQAACRACRRGAGHRTPARDRGADRPGPVSQARPGAGHADRAGHRPGLQARVRPRTACRDRHQLPLGALLGVRPYGSRTTCAAGDGLGAGPQGRHRKRLGRPGIWPTAPWCSMSVSSAAFRGPVLPAGAMGTPATGSKAAADGLRAAAPPAGCRWPSRCSRATPPTRKPWPPRSPNSRTGSG